jgi:hypothetical protein
MPQNQALRADDYLKVNGYRFYKEIPNDTATPTHPNIHQTEATASFAGTASSRLG